jgi:hypothetical protein
MSGKHRQLTLIAMDTQCLEKGASPSLNDGVIRRKLPEFTINKSFLPIVERCVRSGLVVQHSRGRRGMFDIRVKTSHKNTVKGLAQEKQLLVI